MSFSINWKAFSCQYDFQNHIRDLLTNALNKSRPHILEDRIEVLNLDWGTEAPVLEMLEVGDLAADRFRGVFKLNYNGSATITVTTKVQANLLNVYAKSAPSDFTTPKFVGAPASFPIPLNLTLRNIKLQGTVIVVFSKLRGLTLVFRNDPLQSIDVSSTFDTFPIIASFLQQQIETQIRTLFREEVPAVLHKLSLKYLPHIGSSEDVVVKSKPEAGEPVKFAEIDTERPVSLVNVLHIEAMMSSRRTLALETPVMPTAIVRSQLGHWSSLSFQHSPSLNIDSDDKSVYELLYAQSKHLGPRHTQLRKPKRRVIRLRKNHNTHCEEESTAVEPLVEPVLANASTSTIGDTETDILFEKLQERLAAHSHMTHPNPLYVAQRLPLTPSIVRDSKRSAPNFSLFVPHGFSHGEAWTLPVHELDELPPAYDA